MAFKSSEEKLAEAILSVLNTKIQTLTDTVLTGLTPDMYWYHVGAIRELEDSKTQFIEHFNKLFPAA